jgi:16S rRNA (adenine1518-N6/adenine1519-N6)-dimethyltransferase
VTAPLHSPARVRELLERFGLRPSKGFGQNFLIDGNTLRFIVDASGATTGASVLEVGPGLGVLTRALAETGADVTALEKDRRLEAVLGETLEGLENVRVVFTDALEWDYTSLPEDSLLCANLPYYISTALLTRFLESGRFAQLTVLVQREVADRLEASPGSDGYGFLSALIALYGRAERLRDVSKNAFYPAPDVTSSVVRVRVTKGAKPRAGVIRVLEAALGHRRKTLRNNLKLAGYDDAQIAAALLHARLEPSVRGEVVSLDGIQALAEVLEPASAEPEQARTN